MSTYHTELCLEIDGLDLRLEVAIDYSYSPGSPAYTYPGEYAPTDPPEPEETSVGDVRLKLSADDIECPKWLRDQIRDSEEIHRALCRDAERRSQPDPDAAYEAWRDEGRGSASGAWWDD